MLEELIQLTQSWNGQWLSSWDTSQLMKQGQNEVRHVGNGKSNITEDDLDKMHYLKVVTKENLWLYPHVPLLVPQLSSQDVQIKGYDIAAGAVVFTNAWAIGRDPATWDLPDEFRPERFLNNSIPYIDIKGHDFQVIPFGQLAGGVAQDCHLPWL